MGIFSKKKKRNPYTENYVDEDVENVVEEEEKDNGVALDGQNVQMKIYKPTDLASMSAAADFLKSGKTVILNLEGIDHAICRRMIDFMAGVAYALETTIKSTTKDSYIIAPKSVDVSGETEVTKFEDDTFTDI